MSSQLKTIDKQALKIELICGLYEILENQGFNKERLPIIDFKIILETDTNKKINIEYQKGQFDISIK